METLSTILFVNEDPVGYTVRREQNRVELDPAQNSTRSEEAPRLVAERAGANWQVQGTDDQELIRQVLKEVNLLERATLGAGLSAAP